MFWPAILIGFSCYHFIDHKMISIIILLFTLKFYFYNTLDLFIDKELVFDDNDNLYIRYLGLKLKLDKRKSFLIIDDSLALSNRSISVHTLYLYRRRRPFYLRLFKNKIRLYATQDVEEAKTEAWKISDMFGIHFFDVYNN